jgi:hypothetical protein
MSLQEIVLPETKPETECDLREGDTIRHAALPGFELGVADLFSVTDRPRRR